MTTLPLRHQFSLRVSVALCLLTLPLLGVAAFWIAAGEGAELGRIADAQAGEIEDLAVQNGKVAALSGARAYSAILEIGVATGELKLPDLLHPAYVEIQYPGIEVDNPRFHTPFDAYTDSHGIQGIQDAILASSTDFRYASGIDRNGYVPTPITIQSEPPTGDPAHDKVHSLAKMKYNGEQLTAANFIGSRAQPTLVLPYTRPTGENVLDVAATIFVQGRPFGAFRVGVLRDRIAARQAAIRDRIATRQHDRTIDLVVAFSALALALSAFILVAIRRSMRPLGDLARRADDISMGSDIGTAIRSDRRDEIGEVTRAVNRLRASMAAAMSRIGE